MDIDKLFKVPKIPTGGNKRRMPDNPTPEMLKKMRLDASSTSASTSTAPGPSSSSRAPSSRRATVQDITDQDEEMGDEEVDRDFAPGGDADYFAEEDEEGRFYGGGLTKEQKDILNIFDRDVGEEAREDMEEMNIAALRRLLLRFERAMNKNQDQRSKWPDDPTKFIDSEADLDASLKALLPLAQHPILAYPELVKSGTIVKLIGLLSHENVDIVIDVVEVIHELTDEDGGDGESDEEEVEEGDDTGGQGKRERALKELVDALLENSILELLVDNLKRLNEAEESDKQGVFHILGIFENVLALRPTLASIFVSKTTILDWLLDRIQSKVYDENRGYAAELLSILLQNEKQNRGEFGKKDGVEVVLKVLSQYRKHDPPTADETEFMENLFDALCSALSEPTVKQLFLGSEGVDLMVLMMKEKKAARSRSIKVLDFAMSDRGETGSRVAETFVEALGLKSLFSVFMGKVVGGKSSKKKEKEVQQSPEDVSHALGIVSSLLTQLASDSPSRLRVLAKFVENTYEKVDRLLEVREGAISRLKKTEKEIEAEKKTLLEEEGEVLSEMEDLWYLRRLDEGLFTLQTVDYILAWIAMEDDGIRQHLQAMLRRRSRSLRDVISTLKIYHDNVDENGSSGPSAATVESEPSQKEILSNLVAFLEGVETQS